MENIVRNGEIACNKPFLLFSQCFLPHMVLIFHFKCTLKCRLLCFNLDKSKILSSGNGLTLSQTTRGFYVSAVQVFRKHCGKRRNCSQQAISSFPSVFSTLLENFLPFSSNSKLSSANSLSLEESKICCLGKG